MRNTSRYRYEIDGKEIQINFKQYFPLMYETNSKKSQNEND